jgi:hypothetical protein
MGATNLSRPQARVAGPRRARRCSLALGMFVTAGMSVDASALRETLDGLRQGLERPAVSFVAAGALGHDRQRVTASLKVLLEQVDRTDMDVVRARSGLAREFQPEAQALRNVFASLQGGWREFITRSLGKEKLLTLSRLLTSATPDLLRILGREDEENSHSDLIAWLLSPKRAPTIAKHALVALTTKLENPSQWQSRIEAAADADLISVRREMLIGRDLAGSNDLCRVDIVVSGPRFILAIENKVWASEHWDQTTLYWSWLEPMSGLRAGLFLSPSGLAPSSPAFVSASYIQLVSALLEGPTRASITSAEEIVLSSYLKTLQRYIVPVEIKAAIDAVRVMEGK